MPIFNSASSLSSACIQLFHTSTCTSRGYPLIALTPTATSWTWYHRFDDTQPWFRLRVMRPRRPSQAKERQKTPCEYFNWQHLNVSIDDFLGPPQPSNFKAVCPKMGVRLSWW